MCKNSREFTLDDNTLAAIYQMRPRYGVRTAEQMIIRALALASVAARESVDGIFTIVHPSGKLVEVDLQH